MWLNCRCAVAQRPQGFPHRAAETLPCMWRSPGKSQPLFIYTTALHYDLPVWLIFSNISVYQLDAYTEDVICSGLSKLKLISLHNKLSLGKGSRAFVYKHNIFRTGTPVIFLTLFSLLTHGSCKMAATTSTSMLLSGQGGGLGKPYWVHSFTLILKSKHLCRASSRFHFHLNGKIMSHVCTYGTGGWGSLSKKEGINGSWVGNQWLWLYLLRWFWVLWKQELSSILLSHYLFALKSFSDPHFPSLTIIGKELAFDTLNWPI